MMADGIVLVHPIRRHAQCFHSTGFVDHTRMKHMNPEQERRLLELAKEKGRQRADYLNGLSDYLQNREQLVSAHRINRLSLAKLTTKLKEARKNYLTTLKNLTY